MSPDDRRYHREHLWAQGDGERVRAGVTDHAQEELGEVVYIDLPEAGTTVEQGEPFGEIESTKTVSDLHAPVGGRIIEHNDRLDTEPDLVNTDPYGEGWLVVIDADDPADIDGLLTAQEYDQLVQN